MTRHPRHIFAALLTAICIAGLTACQAPPGVDGGDPPGDGVIDDIFPKPKPGEGKTITAVNIHRLLLPLNESTAAAWALVDEDAFPPITRTVWNANGMRVGVMESKQLADFADAIPGIMGVNRSRLSATNVPVVLMAAPEQRDVITVDLTIPPRTVREKQAQGGRLQMLATLNPEVDGGPGDAVVRVELTPHHYVRQVRLTPVDPLVSRLDGRLFTELTLRADLPAEKMLVVGLYLPQDQPLVPADEPGPAAPDDLPSTDPDARISAAPEDKDLADSDKNAQTPDDIIPPAHLGRALFTGRRAQRNVQMMLLISAEQVPEQPSTPPAK